MNRPPHRHPRHRGHRGGGTGEPRRHRPYGRPLWSAQVARMWRACGAHVARTNGQPCCRPSCRPLWSATMVGPVVQRGDRGRTAGAAAGVGSAPHAPGTPAWGPPLALFSPMVPAPKFQTRNLQNQNFQNRVPPRCSERGRFIPPRPSAPSLGETVSPRRADGQRGPGALRRTRRTGPWASAPFSASA